MSSYEGLTVGEMLQFILAKCKKSNWDANRLHLVKLLNMAVSELEADSQLTFAYWETPTEVDVAEYLLPEDMGILYEVFIKETGTEGALPLLPASFRQYQASLADDDESEVVEP